MPDNKQLFNTKMNALASAINTKAGSPGAKDLDALKTAVDNLKIDSNDYKNIEGTLAAPFGEFENDADLIANGLYTGQMSAILQIDVSPLEMGFSSVIVPAKMYVNDFSINFYGVMPSGNSWLSTYIEYDTSGELQDSVLIVDGTVNDMSFAASQLNTNLLILIHPIDDSSELKFTLTSNLTQPLYLTQSSAYAVTVDWGDGSAEDNPSELAASLSHTYAEPGDYIVHIKCAIGKTWSPGLTSGNNHYGIIGKQTAKSDTYPTLTSFKFGRGARLDVESAFTQCTGLTNVLLTDEISRISARAFNKCTHLISVTIPDSVTSIGDEAFLSCTSLTSVTIPYSVASMGRSAFSLCHGLTSVIIGSSVTSIGECAFQSCTGLTSVIIGSSVTSIGKTAFQECTNLTSVTIPDNVTSIGDNAFKLCTGLTSVIIGSSVTSIGDFAFQNCTGLISMTCKAIAPPQIKSATFNKVPADCIIHVLAGSVVTYQAAQYWSDRAAYIQAIPSS